MVTLSPNAHLTYKVKPTQTESAVLFLSVCGWIKCHKTSVDIQYLHSAIENIAWITGPSLLHEEKEFWEIVTMTCQLNFFVIFSVHPRCTVP